MISVGMMFMGRNDIWRIQILERLSYIWTVDIFQICILTAENYHYYYEICIETNLSNFAL